MSIPDPETLLAKTRASQQDAQEPEERLPPTETIHIDCKDGRGHEYKHSFYFTVPKLGTRLDIANMKLGYLPAGPTPDVMVDQLVHMICFLTATITFNDRFPKPHWWDFWNLYDATPFTVLYREATLYESRFHGEPAVDGGDQVADVEQPDTGDRSDSPSLGRKVQPPTERPETLAANRT